ncbi:sensor histidine kinase [Novosphingobium colocasiae]|uniref:sensor histidine kinase n=1 Tax=Novosphingobium colocasiae TaxID=1256513 RepID=UPI0035B4E25B
MNGEAITLARALCDGDNRLLEADEPLAGLQLRSGGELPGTIAIPELLELVRKARRFRFRMGRAINALDGGEAVSAWVEVVPDSAGEGCEIRVRNWQTSACPTEDSATIEQRRQATDRHVAELSARLDARQRVLTVLSDSPELAALTAAMETGHGRHWTEFLPPENATHQQPLHWRLLDGARVTVSGSLRSWRVSLIPHMQPGFDPDGFELLLLSDQPPAVIAAPAAAPVGQGLRTSLVGQDLAPVLHQPISRIIANAETIRTRLAGPLPDDYAQYAQEIAHAGRHLLDLLKDLGDLEVVEADGFHTAPDRIDLAEVCRQAAGILNVRAREAGVLIDAPGQGDHVPAIAEFRRVLQILLNLITNAIKYAPQGSHVWLTAGRHGDGVRAVVTDAGPGITPADQAKVFEKFERLGRSGDGGSGLGLFISRRLARAMGGELSVESAPGHGARFILDLPADPQG